MTLPLCSAPAQPVSLTTLPTRERSPDGVEKGSSVAGGGEGMLHLLLLPHDTTMGKR